MREILFRAKVVDDDKWVYGYYTSSGENGWIERKEADNPDSLDVYLVNTETLGQFTGLYDKNGTKIFEGDIVKARMTDKYTVVFNRGSFMGEYTSPYGGYTVRVDLLKDDWEVIGNIYDNTELLEETK